jgi:uncharacterized coiled-coil protein SlyX
MATAQEIIMAKAQEIIDGLKAQVASLTKAETDREARDVAEETATDAQIALQKQTIADLQAVIDAGGLTPQQVQDLTDVGAGMKAVQDSLEAADPTPPVVP